MYICIYVYICVCVYIPCISLFFSFFRKAWPPDSAIGLAFAAAAAVRIPGSTVAVSANTEGGLAEAGSTGGGPVRSGDTGGGLVRSRSDWEADRLAGTRCCRESLSGVKVRVSPEANALSGFDPSEPDIYVYIYIYIYIYIYTYIDL